MSSKRAIRRKSCKGKQRYQSAAEAGRAIVALHHDRGYQGMLTSYHCPFCGGFHFGHPPAQVAKAIKARRSGDRV